MKPKTYIMIGRSGSGKGTQTKLLKEYTEKQDPETEILHIESGDEFRDFLRRDAYASKLAKGIITEGKLQPAFLAVWVWADSLIKYLDDKKHIILDGTPRKLSEALVLNEALSFYGRENVNVIYINVSTDWATDKLMSRKSDRTDDTREGIKKRQGWFDTDTMQAIDFYRDDSGYNFFEINGEQAVEEVHNEIVENLEK
jgi:adenylate kinase family enzyme